MFNELRIEIFADYSYSLNSRDNINFYDKIWINEDIDKESATLLGIKVWRKELVICSCLLGAEGYRHGTLIASTLMDRNKLLVCCGNVVFSLELPTLNLLWKTKVDTVACFEIHKLEQDYVTYGEIEISRIDMNGKIKWQFSGKDIFISINNKTPFRLEKDHIALTDFLNEEYRIDFNGKLIS